MSDNLERNRASRIGCHCWGTSAPSAEAIPDFAHVGCRWVRATRPMQMDIVSTGPRTYNFGDHGERSIDLALEHGMSVMGLLDGRWGNETRLNRLPYASPIWEHLDLWEDFVGATVEHYRTRVKVWEVLNEPPFFWWYPTPAGELMPEVNPPLKRAPVWAYAHLLKATTRVIRALDPSASIVAGSGFADGHFLKHLYAAGARGDFDIASVHYLNCRHPDDFGRGFACVRAVMAEAGDDHLPLWDTESGPAGAVIGCAVQTPAAYEALYTIYRHCFAHQFGLQRYFWFNPLDRLEAGVAPESCRACREADGALTPAYRAMQVLTTQVGDGPLLEHAHLEGEVHAYVFRGPAGPVSILWSTAPARARLPGRSAATDFLGRPVALSGDWDLTGRPLYIPGNILPSLDATLTGRRETVVACSDGKRADPKAPRCVSPRLTPNADWTDGAWTAIPMLAAREEVAVPSQQNHFCLVPTSVAAELQLAHDDDALYLRVRTFDDRLAADAPSGFVQFTFRDENPDIAEWAYFYNSYALFTLFASPRGAKLLRFDPLFADRYPSGPVERARVRVQACPDGLLYTARIPWDTIGPVTPGRHNPAYLMFTFNRADNMLDVPAGDTPEEWSHNFADTFIVKPPALARFVDFD